MKILIIKASSLGDIIHAFPTVAFLRQKFPEATIDWVVEKPFRELVEAHPDVNRVLTLDTKAWRKSFRWNEMFDFRRQLQSCTYDLVLDLQGNTKSGLITWLAKAKVKVGFGKKSVAEWPNRFFTHVTYDPPPGTNVRAEYLYLAQNYFNDFTSSPSQVVLRLTLEQQKALENVLENPIMKKSPLIMLCPGSAWRNKQLSEKALEELLSTLDGFFLLIWGNAEERTLAERLSKIAPKGAFVVDRLPLPALQHLMARMQLVIAVDSLPLHLAGTTAVATFSLFGPSSALKYKPEGDSHYSLQGPCPYGRTFDRRCPILRSCPTGSCIRDIDGNSISLKINKLKII